MRFLPRCIITDTVEILMTFPGEAVNFVGNAIVYQVNNVVVWNKASFDEPLDCVIYLFGRVDF